MSLAHSYVVGQSTASHIIGETLEAIWDTMHLTVMPMPETEDWLEISSGFRQRWDYPNVVGAIDGKHIRIEVISCLSCKDFFVLYCFILFFI